MKDLLYCLCYAAAFSMIGNALLHAETTEVVLSNNMKCTKEELMTFFPQQVVHSILIEAHIPEEQAKAIAQELSQKDRELAQLVEEKAAKVEPNPFKDLSQRDLAIRIYRDTLYEVFAKVLKSHGVTNEDQIKTLLDEMQAAKSRLFIECIRKQQHTSSPPSFP
jgi:hypothetical protein